MLPGHPSNPFAGMALDYLIGTDAGGNGRTGRVLEVAYDVDDVPSLGPSVAYCNLFDEKDSGRFPPYRAKTDTAEEFDEGVPDANGPGFIANINEQLTRRKNSGFRFIEWDNPDAYAVADVVRAVAMAESQGLGVVAKNPGLMQSDPTPYVAHPNVYGIIVEKDAGTPTEMDVLRRKAGKPNLPVWFVSFEDGRDWATRTAQAITSSRFVNMGVTYSREGEYENSEDVLAPIADGPPDIPSTTQPSTTQPSTTQSSAGNPLLLLLLALATLAKETRIADDSVQPAQGLDFFRLLLPMLLQSALSGKQIDIGQLLSAMLTGQVPAPAAPAPQPISRQSTDLTTLLLPLLIQRLTGTLPPGAAQAAPAQSADRPGTESTAPAIQKPSVQLSAAGLALTSILQTIGIIGTPFGAGTQPTTAGTLATLIPILTGAIGMTGGFGSLLSFGRGGAAGKGT